MLAVILIVSAFLRCNLPRWRFTDLVDGNQRIKVVRLEVSGNSRNIVCTDPEVLEFMNTLLHQSNATSRQFSGHSPRESLTSFSITFHLNDGFAYNVPAVITKRSITLGGKTEWQVGPGAPYRVLLFENSPDQFRAFIDSLLSEDTNDENAHRTM